jgi:hypothetical protein
MELHGLDRPVPVPERHDLAGRRARRDLEDLRQRFVRHERVVAPDEERFRQAGEQSAPVVVQWVGVAVHGLVGEADDSAAGAREDLLPEADTQRRQMRPDACEQCERGPRRIRAPGTRPEDETIEGRQGRGESLRPHHVHVAREFAQQRHEVPSERVLVVDEQDTQHAAIAPRAGSEGDPSLGRGVAGG